MKAVARSRLEASIATPSSACTIDMGREQQSSDGAANDLAKRLVRDVAGVVHDTKHAVVAAGWILEVVWENPDQCAPDAFVEAELPVDEFATLISQLRVVLGRYLPDLLQILGVPGHP
eukprot:CAMPEP_0175871182 /NCGR_PEP_ID=MMETSP0107_2-20121207/36988_1 /TAXON_ID=195067 ORGANISM="Goniomonas pacifica, Strain CCMP1869" /NCGR_SAMPLE_ID=MMETSP0107_2 /ASSEMBLY_ACC=CAM_ASM_000203 /LENGTH=117 /DNA_ID=CAMNT_0017189523 /DNA_START=124 /DNA_END=474 /DNA_ORIENTATION=-